jgi:hypothetical protein
VKGPPQEGSSSFLKKRTKKLLLLGMHTDRAGRVNQQNKSFLVLFFKKELLPSRLATAIGITPMRCLSGAFGGVPAAALLWFGGRALAVRDKVTG